MTGAQSPHALQGAATPSVAAGVAAGVTAALAWAIYNVGVAIGRTHGFTSADLALLRYAVPAVLLLPLLVRRRRRASRRLDWVRAFWLTVSIGPPFAFLINTGYGIAPLAHAVVISPGMTMLTANALAIVLDGRPLPGAQADRHPHPRRRPRLHRARPAGAEGPRHVRMGR